MVEDTLYKHEENQEFRLQQCVLIQMNSPLYNIFCGKSGAGRLSLKKKPPKQNLKQFTRKKTLAPLSMRTSQGEERVSSVLVYDVPLSGYDGGPFAMPLLSLSQRQGISEWRSLVSPQSKIPGASANMILRSFSSI